MVANGLLLAPLLESTPFVATYQVAAKPEDARDTKQTALQAIAQRCRL
jgi:hypothetical protein